MTGDNTGRQPAGTPTVTVPPSADDVEAAAPLTVGAAVLQHDPALRRVGRLMRTVGIVGVVAGIAAIAVGLWLLHDIDTMFGRSLRLTSDSLATVDASLAVAADSVAVVNDGLGDAERTSRGLRSSLEEGADLLSETADLTRDDVAGSLESFHASMPALIQVSGTIDTTLRAVDQLPVGPEYDPDEPFDESLRQLRDDLEGLPGDLRDQADAIDDASTNLDTVGRQSVGIADSMLQMRTSLTRAERVLGQYQNTTGQARDLIAQTEADLQRRLWILRGLVIALGLIYCIGQVLPIFLGTRMAEAFAPAAQPSDSESTGI